MRVKRDQHGRIRKPVKKTASTKVFAVPELLEMILDQIPPLNLYGMRRVNTAFRDTINRKKYRSAMLLDPANKLDIPLVNQILQSPEITKALPPFAIKAAPSQYRKGRDPVYTDRSGDTLYISVVVDEDLPLRSASWRRF